MLTSAARVPIVQMDMTAAPATDAAPARVHHPGLDGLRGLAVAGVLLFHGGFSWAAGGFLGVSTFFTLSGFLITGLLLAEHARNGRIALGDFWARRFRRLLPASMVALAGIAVFGATVATPEQIRNLRGDVLGAIGYVANWRFVFSGTSYGDLFSAPSPAQHFWSLAIEEQFYVLFPLLVAGLLWLGRGRRTVLTVVLVALTALSVFANVAAYDPSGDTSRIYYGTDTRAAELLLGALLAVGAAWWANRRSPAAAIPQATVVTGGRSWLVLSLARNVGGPLALLAMLGLWVLVDQNDAWLYRGGFAAVGVLTAVVVLASVATGSVRTVLSARPLRWLGRLSYGLYLYHWPVFLWLTPARTGLDPAVNFALRFGLTAALAIASYALVEQPVRLGRIVRAGWRPLVAAPASAVAVAVMAVAVTIDPPAPTFEFESISNQGRSEIAAPPPVPAAASAATVGTAAANAHTDKGLAGSASGAPSSEGPSGAAASGAAAMTDSSADGAIVASAAVPAGPVRVMVVGDSVGFVLAEALVRWGETSGRAVVWNTSIPGCGIVRGGVVLGQSGRAETPVPGCEAWDGRWRRQLAEFDPDVVLVHSASWDLVPRMRAGETAMRVPGDPLFDAHVVGEYTAAVDALSSTGAEVVWLTPPCVESPNGAKEGVFEPGRMERLADHILPSLRAQRPGLAAVDLAARVCPRGEFTSTLGGIVDARPDGIHFVPAAADWLAAWIGPQLVR